MGGIQSEHHWLKLLIARTLLGSPSELEPSNVDCRGKQQKIDQNYQHVLLYLAGRVDQLI